MLLDSLCITSWRARPVSFVSLMSLYESNYLRLQALVGDVRGAMPAAGLARRRATATCTSTCSSTRPTRRWCGSRICSRTRRAPLADPDLELRVYHDARLAEASHCGRWIRHRAWSTCGPASRAQLGERWLRNMLLNKWLDYCLERGHAFDPPRRVPGCMRLPDGLRRLAYRLAGREPSVEDERLVELFRNRAELKKELQRARRRAPPAARPAEAAGRLDDARRGADGRARAIPRPARGRLQEPRVFPAEGALAHGVAPARAVRRRTRAPAEGPRAQARRWPTYERRQAGAHGRRRARAGRGARAGRAAAGRAEARRGSGSSNSSGSGTISAGASSPTRSTTRAAAHRGGAARR